MINNFDFKYGKVIYNEFNIDFSLLFSEQLDCLTEDLLQVKYTDKYILDIGWFPEYELNGSFIIQIIVDKNWDDPIYYRNCITQKEFIETLDDAIIYANMLYKKQF